MKKVPEPGYTIREAEILLGIPHKRGYALIKEKRLRGVVDVTGQMRIPAAEVYSVPRAREKGVSDV